MSAFETRCASISEPPIMGGYEWQISKKEVFPLSDEWLISEQPGE
jgi:hypothetical protein